MAVFSEANFYDALVDLLGRTRGVTGRRALLLISTGLDTFSRATFNDVLAMAEKSETPIYGIGLAGFVRRAVTGEVGPLSKLDWGRANEQLRSLANVTGGRMYLRDTNLDVQALYDDFMEHLRVRYVITYAAPAGGMAGSKHTVRVALVDGSGSGPLRIVDAAGKAITARLSTEASYTR
jgi:VWFA-related protein